jgi:hypothetical protein
VRANNRLLQTRRIMFVAIYRLRPAGCRACTFGLRVTSLTRSKFIRVQEVLQQLDPDDEHWPEFQAREKAMLRAFGEGWAWEVFGDSSMDDSCRCGQQPPPVPWRETGRSVGGLTEVGFDDQSELLLVVRVAARSAAAAPQFHSSQLSRALEKNERRHKL